MQKYNSIVKFRIGEEIHFPDFSIRHTEERKVPAPNNGKWVKTFLHFEVFGEFGIEKIMWASGRYDEIHFTYNNSEYALVLRAYQNPNAKEKSFLILEDDEMIIRKLSSV